MLKLHHRGADKSIWLVGPVMKLGSAKTSDLVVAGPGVEAHHCSLHISDREMLVEAMDDCAVYLNEKPVNGKVPMSVGDVIRIVTHEFVITDPKEKAGTAAPVADKPVVSAEETVFRGVPQAAAPQQGSGWMLQGLHKSLQNKRYPLEGSMTLGRSPECELHFSYERLSRKHAELKVIDGKLVIRDLDSSNGTFRNGEKVQQATLHHGDTLSFDKLEFAVVGPSNNASALSSAEPMNQTVVRSAITPDVIKQAKEAGRQSQKPADNAVQKAQQHNHTSSIIMVAVAVIVLGLLAFVFLT